MPNTPAPSSAYALPLAATEVRRGVLRIEPGPTQQRAEDVLHGFQHTRSNDLAYFSRQALGAAAIALEKTGLRVATIQSEIESLCAYAPGDPASGYFGHYSIPDTLGINPEKLDWYKYSFSTRRRLRARPRKEAGGSYSLFLRAGQVVMALDDGRHRGHYLPVVGEAGGPVIERCPNPQSALEECHRQSLPAKVYYEAKPELAPFVALYHTHVWLPPRHYDLLYKRMVGPKAEGSGNERYALIHAQDLPLAEQILSVLGVTLSEGAPPERANERALDIVEQSARAVRQAYTAYLKSEEGLKQLETIGLERCWEQVEDPKFYNLLASLSNSAYAFEPMAEELLAYLVDRLPRSLDWKQLRAAGSQDWLIEGVVLDADAGETESSTRRGGVYSSYYKVAVQELGLVLGIMTKRDLVYSGGGRAQPGYFVAGCWRATPYAGRLKLTGDSSTLLAERASGRLAAEAGYSYIYGIPSIEAQLAEDLYLSAFFLDRDGKYWEGHNELSRYFAGHGRLVEKMVADFDEPAALFQDVFGNYFFLRFGGETYTEHRSLIESSQVGTWKRFVAHGGLRSLLKAEGALPAFDLLEGVVPRDVGHLEVAEGAVLGLLRYYGKMAETDLNSRLTASFISDAHAQQAVANLEKRGRIARSGSDLYYGYPFCSPADRIRLANVGEIEDASLPARAYYAGIRPFLPIMHPLGYGSPLASAEPEGSMRGFFRQKLQREDRFSLAVSRQGLVATASEAVRRVQEEGVATLRAHPWNRSLASDIAKQVRAELPTHDIKVRRRDVPGMYQGKETTVTWLCIYSEEIIARAHFVAQLRHHWGARGGPQPVQKPTQRRGGRR